MENWLATKEGGTVLMGNWLATEEGGPVLMGNGLAGWVVSPLWDSLSAENTLVAIAASENLCLAKGT